MIVGSYSPLLRTYLCIRYEREFPYSYIEARMVRSSKLHLCYAGFWRDFQDTE